MGAIRASLDVTEDLGGRLSVQGGVNAKVSMGTVAYADGANDYERLANLPSIEGTLLKGDRTLLQIGVSTTTPQEIDNLIFG